MNVEPDTKWSIPFGPGAASGALRRAFVVPNEGALAADELRAWVNGRVGKIQRLADLRYVAELPRSDIGKVLKRQLRDGYTPG